MDSIPKRNDVHLRSKTITYEYCGHSVKSSIFHSEKYRWCPKCMDKIKREREELKKHLPYWLSSDDLKSRDLNRKQRGGRNRNRDSRRSYAA